MNALQMQIQNSRYEAVITREELDDKMKEASRMRNLGSIQSVGSLKGAIMVGITEQCHGCTAKVCTLNPPDIKCPLLG